MAGASIATAAATSIMEWIRTTSSLIDNLTLKEGTTIRRTFTLTSANFGAAVNGAFSLSAPVNSDSPATAATLNACEMAGYFTGTVGGSGSTIVMVPNTVGASQPVTLNTLTFAHDSSA